MNRLFVRNSSARRSIATGGRRPKSESVAILGRLDRLPKVRISRGIDVGRRSGRKYA
jgi:hypothetical protein